MLPRFIIFEFKPIWHINNLFDLPKVEKKFNYRFPRPLPSDGLSSIVRHTSRRATKYGDPSNHVAAHHSRQTTTLTGTLLELLSTADPGKLVHELRTNASYRMSTTATGSLQTTFPRRTRNRRKDL